MQFEGTYSEEFSNVWLWGVISDISYHIIINQINHQITFNQSGQSFGQLQFTSVADFDIMLHYNNMEMAFLLAGCLLIDGSSE